MKVLTLELPDGSKWGVPVSVIALDRAKHYAHEFDGDVDESLKEDTNPLFEADAYEVQDWAVNNMNWRDVSDHAFPVSPARPPDFQAAWLNGVKEVVDVPR